MSRLISIPNQIRNEELAAKIIEQAKSEFPTIKAKNDIRSNNGFNIRFRNRLVKEAGYTYNEAYYAMRKVSYE